MSDLIPSSYVKVKIAGKRSVYLEQVKQFERGGRKFVSGYEIDKNAESRIFQDGLRLHLIELGEGRTVIPQLQSKTYGDLHDAS
jgi:uncharacterized protein with HEPN domain